MVYIISLATSVFFLILFFSLFRFTKNMDSVCLTITSLVPIMGPIVIIMFFIIGCINMNNYDKWMMDRDIMDDNVKLYLRDNKVCRWLFNCADIRLFGDDKHNKMINEDETNIQ